MSKKEWRTLPSGEATQNMEVYVEAWRSLGRKVVEVLGPETHVIGFDPGVLVGRPGRRSLSIDSHIALALARLVDDRNALRRVVRRLPLAACGASWSVEGDSKTLCYVERQQGAVSLEQALWEAGLEEEAQAVVCKDGVEHELKHT